MYHGHLSAPWQDDPGIYYGKHVRLTLPPTAGIGYPIPTPEPVYSFNDPLKVSRAIPVEGLVTDPGPSWARSPQARFWLESKKPTPIQRTLMALKRAVGCGNS